MLKHAMIYFALSVLVILFAKYAHLIIVYIVMAYTYVNVKLAPLFSATAAGTMLRQTLVLVLIPLIIAGIPALIYRIIKKQTMPYFMEITWTLWLVVVLSKILIH